MNLFDLTENYIRFFTELQGCDEITPEMEEMADNLNIAIEEKCDNYARMIKNLEADINAYKEQEKIFTDKRRAAENKVKWLKNNLQASMEQMGRRKVKTDLFSFNIQRNAPSLEIKDDSKIGDEYWQVERKLNKKELLNDIKEGLIIEVVELKQSESLRIR